MRIEAGGDPYPADPHQLGYPGLDAGPGLLLQPTVTWPRTMTVGRPHLVEVELDLIRADGAPVAWPFTEEELAYTCLLRGSEDIDLWAVHGLSVVVHRFGGSYGPAEFVVTPGEGPDDRSLWLTIATPWGVVVGTHELKVRVRAARQDQAQEAGTPASLPSATAGLADASQLPGDPALTLEPLATAPAAAVQPSAQGIVLLGPAGAGKATFLAALYTALTDQQTGWRLRGDDAASAAHLVKATDTLVGQGHFPRATFSQEGNSWSLSLLGRLEVREWRWYGPRRRTVDLAIPLHWVDAPGVVADADWETDRNATDRMLGAAQQSHGIVFFFDPLREARMGDFFKYVHGILLQLRARMQTPGKLPHYVAVCITKFDEIRVFELAREMHIITFDAAPPELPRVPEEYALEFFQHLTQTSEDDTANLLLPLLRQTFHEERIKFFVTSAIGFYVDPDYGVFDPGDCQNYIPAQGADAPERVRGQIFPVNVAEPVLWLGGHVTDAAKLPRREPGRLG